MIHLNILQYDADDPSHAARAAILDEPTNDCILHLIQSTPSDGPVVQSAAETHPHALLVRQLIRILSVIQTCREQEVQLKYRSHTRIIHCLPVCMYAYRRGCTFLGATTSSSSLALSAPRVSCRSSAEPSRNLHVPCSKTCNSAMH